MNQVNTFSGSEPSAGIPGGCCCGSGNNQVIKLERETKMNEVNKNNNEITTVVAPEIMCGGCANSIKKALGNLDGVFEVNVDAETKKVSVEHSENVSREDIVNALDSAGFSAV